MVIKYFSDADESDFCNSNTCLGVRDTSSTSEIIKIKSHLDVSNIRYMSDNIQCLLGLNIINDSKCFENHNSVFRAIQEGAKYRVILYIRLSVEDGDLVDGDVSGSIRNQLLFLLDECEKRDWMVVGIFCEEDISGVLDDRPEWNKSLKFCENGNTEIVLCKSQSRFSRSMEVIEKYLHNKFVEWGVRFVSIVDNADTSNISNKKARQINGLVNEWQVEDQSNNIRAILKNKQSNGLFTGSFAPYGYMKDPNDKYHLIIDEDAAKVVRKIFYMFALGNGAVNICNYLNKNKIPVPSVYKKMKGLKYHNSVINLNRMVKYMVEEGDNLASIADRYHSNVDEIIEYNKLKSSTVKVGDIIMLPIRTIWKTATIYNMLKDEVYIGTLVQHKNEIISYKNKKERKVPENQRIKVPHCHSAIIDGETWNLVRSRFESGRKNKTSKNGKMALFSKKIICGGCGCTFYRNRSFVKDGEIYYWQCGNRYATGCYLCSNRKSVKEDEIYDLVLREINNKLDIYYDKLLVEKEYYESLKNDTLEKEISSLSNEMVTLENNIMKKENILSLLYDDRTNGLIDTQEFLIIKNRNSFEIDKMKTRIKMIDKELRNLMLKKSSKFDNEKILMKYKKFDKLDRNILDEFISKIYIGYYNPKDKSRNIKLKWNIVFE